MTSSSVYNFIDLESKVILPEYLNAGDIYFSNMN
jgi:hypothetical protein